MLRSSSNYFFGSFFEGYYSYFFSNYSKDSYSMFLQVIIPKFIQWFLQKFRFLFFLQGCFLKALLDLLKRFFSGIPPQILYDITSEIHLEYFQDILLEVPPGLFSEIPKLLLHKFLVGFIRPLLQAFFRFFF